MSIVFVTATHASVAEGLTGQMVDRDCRAPAVPRPPSGSKAAELEANPRAALVLHWEPPERQVRVEGRVERIGDDESLAYFASRPRGSRLGAWASPQSRTVASREELEQEYAAAEQRFSGVEDVPLPPFWGGYRLLPDAIEFWQVRQNRMHARVRYERSGGDWRRHRLAP